MGTKHNKHSSEFKFRVALAALRGDKTITQLCNEFKVAPSVIHRWKSMVQKLGPKIFEEKSLAMDLTEVHEQEKAKLYQQIGQLVTERDFFKKALSY